MGAPPSTRRHWLVSAKLALVLVGLVLLVRWALAGLAAADGGTGSAVLRRRGSSSPCS
jgi:preprotein translocase subunit SecG